MSFTQAMAEAQKLRTHLLAQGIKKVSIELVPGRGGSGYYANTHLGTMGHHIVSRRSQGLTPFLWLVKQGRADLPGPLCNVYGGFDEVARIICMSWANHPGRGGPYTVESGTVPANNGRAYFMGFEFEGGIVESDWTPSFRTFMGRCHAGTLAYLSAARGKQITERSHIEHKTWAPNRKTDRLGYTLSEARTEIINVGGTMADHSHNPMPSDLPRSWADGVWERYAVHSETNDNTRGHTMYREDIAWVWDRLIKPLEGKIAALERENDDLAKVISGLSGRVAQLEQQGGGGGGIPWGATARLTQP